MSTKSSSIQLAQSAVSLLARVLLAAMFLRYGSSKIGDFAGTAAAIASKGVPLAEIAAAVAIGIEVGLGLFVLAGYRVRFAGAVMAVYLAFITLLFHDFWALAGAQHAAQQMSFYKNLTGVGGLLLLAVYGAGAWSLDALRSRAAAPARNRRSAEALAA